MLGFYAGSEEQSLQDITEEMHETRLHKSSNTDLTNAREQRQVPTPA